MLFGNNGPIKGRLLEKGVRSKGTFFAKNGATKGNVFWLQS